MADRIKASCYRATCFGRPIGPWRDRVRDVRRDLIQQKLGSYDEWGTFYVTVPGGIQRVDEWMDFAEWQASQRAA